MANFETGAALFPFAVGAIAEKKGVKVLQPIALALLVLITFLWILLPGGFTKRALEDARRDRDGRAEVGDRTEKKSTVGRSIGRLWKRLGIA